MPLSRHARRSRSGSLELMLGAYIAGSPTTALPGQVRSVGGPALSYALRPLSPPMRCELPKVSISFTRQHRRDAQPPRGASNTSGGLFREFAAESAAAIRSGLDWAPAAFPTRAEAAVKIDCLPALR